MAGTLLITGLQIQIRYGIKHYQQYELHEQEGFRTS